jgi:hypothetical protein
MQGWGAAMTGTSTYGRVLAGRIYVLAAVFVALLYAILFARSKAFVADELCFNLIVAYFFLSAALLSFLLSNDFPRLYGYVIRRLKKYSMTTWFTAWYPGLFLMLVAADLYTARNLRVAVNEFLVSHKIRELVALSFGVTTSVMMVFFIACNVVAVFRGAVWRKSV